MREKNNLKRRKCQNVVFILVYAIIFINSELFKEWPIFMISTLGVEMIYDHWEKLKIICAL